MFSLVPRCQGPVSYTHLDVYKRQQHVRKLPASLKRSLTWDRGLEMAKHKDFTVATKVQVYFCDPQSPWQRGTNENTNLLLRQYFPRGTDLSGYSQAQLGGGSLACLLQDLLIQFFDLRFEPGVHLSLIHI